MRQLTTIICTLLLAACTSSNTSLTNGGKDVAFKVAERYFFKNGQQPPADPKITDEATFHKLFGMATVMGPQGRPTEIDFQKQFAVAIVLPVTDKSTEITPVSVVEEGNDLVYTYQVLTGEQQTFTIQPLAIILLDKQYEHHNLKLVRK